MKVKALIYCTKAKPYLFKRIYKFATTNLYNGEWVYNGKIVCECEVETEEIIAQAYRDYYCTSINHIGDNELMKRSCLDLTQLFNYLGSTNDFDDDYELFKKVGYALHISNIKVFDKPRELSDYCKITKSLQYEGEEEVEEITKAPQNMMWAYDYVTLTNYVLISVQPQWLCKILNKQKTIEVRRKVLKGMVE